MKVWKLSPTTQQPEGNNGYVRIRAMTEERARAIAQEAFENTEVDKVIHNLDWSDVNWQDKNTIQSEYEGDDDVSSIEGILDVQ